MYQEMRETIAVNTAADAYISALNARDRLCDDSAHGNSARDTARCKLAIVTARCARTEWMAARSAAGVRWQ